MAIRSKYRYSFLLLVLIAAFSSWPGSFVHAASPVPVERQGKIIKADLLPHTELDVCNYSITSVSHVTVQKTGSRPEIIQQYFSGFDNLSCQNRLYKIKSLPEKDYLSQNYPSHNFW